MTDLRDRARDEADLRQRLADLAATITTERTWDHLQTHIATTPPPRTPRRRLSPTRVRLAAAAAAIALAAAALLVAHQETGVVDSADTTTSTTAGPGDTTTSSTQLSATSVPAAPDARDAEVGPAQPSGGGPLGGDRSDTDLQSTSGAAPTATTRPPPTAIPGPIPAGASPDGYPVGVTYATGPDFNPTVTYHQEGDNVVIDVWINRAADGVEHLDTLVVPPRPNQNCLILGTTSAPFPSYTSPQRIIGGVVTTRVATLSVTAPSGGFAFIGHDEIAPGLHAVLVLVDDDTFRVDAAGSAGYVQHSVTESDRDAFPDRC